MTQAPGVPGRLQPERASTFELCTGSCLLSPGRQRQSQEDTAALAPRLFSKTQTTKMPRCTFDQTKQSLCPSCQQRVRSRGAGALPGGVAMTSASGKGTASCPAAVGVSDVEGYTPPAPGPGSPVCAWGKPRVWWRYLRLRECRGCERSSKRRLACPAGNGSADAIYTSPTTVCLGQLLLSGTEVIHLLEKDKRTVLLLSEVAPSIPRAAPNHPLGAFPGRYLAWKAPGGRLQ